MTFLTTAVFAFGLALAVTLPAIADAADEYMKAQMAQQHIPGAAIAVVQNGHVVKVQGYGFAELEKQTPVSAQTVFEIGSLTKQFTAVAVMMLVEQGKVALDDPITQYVGGLPAVWKGVTVRHLLNHTSGIPSYTDQPDFPGRALQDATPAQVIASVSNLPLGFAPGTKFAYSNTGYFLLGMILEKAGGESYAQLLQERLCRLLGLSQTEVNDLSAPIPHRAAGYTVTDGKPARAPRISMTWPGAAGALVSSVSDMIKWDAAQGSPKLLKASSWQLLGTPPTLPGGAVTQYGMGWIVQNVHDHKIVWHNGGIPGFLTNNSRYPDDHLTVVVLTNTDSASVDEIARGLAALYFPSLASPPPVGTPDAPQVTALLKQVLRDIAAGQADPSLFTVSSRAILFPDAMTRLGQSLVSLGTLTSLTLLHQEFLNGQRVFQYRAAYGSLPLICLLALAADGKIETLGLHPAPD